MTSSFGMGSHQATLEEDVTLLNGQTSSSLTGRTSGLPQGQSQVMAASSLTLWGLTQRNSLILQCVDSHLMRQRTF